MKQDLSTLRTCIGLFGGLLLTATFVFPFVGTSFAQTQDTRRVVSPVPTASQTPRIVPPVPIASPTPAVNTGVVEDSGEVLTVDTNEVKLNVRVVDRSNRILNNVRNDEFKVYEDNVLQNITSVDRGDVPVNYGLVIDNSRSLNSQLEKVIEASKILVDNNLPADETFVVRFVSNDQITIEQDFTADKTLLKEQLDDLFTEGGQTAVIDAVMLAAEKASEYEKSRSADDKKRRALILITDGEDRDSYYTEAQLFARLREADVQIFPIGFVNELEAEDGDLFKKSPRKKAVALLERMAKETGGKAYFPNSVDELAGIARDISGELRTQYLISYAPTNDQRDGKYRTIRVAVNDDPKLGKRIAVTKQGRTAAAN